jgi:hypothetical protein
MSESDALFAFYKLHGIESGVFRGMQPIRDGV